MLQTIRLKLLCGLLILASLVPVAARPFEGYIHAIVSSGGKPAGLLYTVGTNFLRVEIENTNGGNTVDILDRQSGILTLLFPRRHCFTRFKQVDGNLPGAPSNSSIPNGSIPDEILPPPRPPPLQPSEIGPTNFPAIPPRPPMPSGGLPPGIGPQAQFANAPNPSAFPQMPAMPSMPPMPPADELELKATGDTTNLLGYPCKRYELKQSGQTMEIWATGELLPFQEYQPNQPPSAGPRNIERYWGVPIAAKGLYPLLASLKFDNGIERLRFEVQSVTPVTLSDSGTKCFQIPEGYVEIPPRRF